MFGHNRISPAYYNEHDPFAAEWLRQLIAAGHIAPGDVDQRSIEDVVPDDLRDYTQCHFFAGIGVWSYALRRAGWPDERPVWTGSPPCQPFSAAGKGKGFADERHLWPAYFHLIDVCRPSDVFGEQVASKDGLAWFDPVRLDLEGAGYAVGVSDLCAAGFGAPHIRQRLYFVGTQGTGGGLGDWPTPRAAVSGPDYAVVDRPNAGGISLATAAAFSSWNTPRATDGSNGGPNQGGGRCRTMSAWSCGRLGESSGFGWQGQRHEPEHRLVVPPVSPGDELMSGWASPQARDHKGSRTGTAMYSDRAGRPLNEQVANLLDQWPR